MNEAQEASTALISIPVIAASEPWLGFDPRQMTDENLSKKLLCCAPGSLEHAALLRERERRRELRVRAFAASEGLTR